MKFHVYEDWTLEENPRCFYVGKGNQDRVDYLIRRSNTKHRRVVEQYGQRRVVVYSTDSEQEALDVERKVISERHVHHSDPSYNGIGCNLTLGGQGRSGRIVSEETCRKISASKKGKKSNKVWSDRERAETSARMSKLHKGKKISDEHKAALRARTDQRGEDNPQSRLTEQDVIEIRTDWESLRPRKWTKASAQFFERWANALNISHATIRNVVSGVAWKHV